MPKHINEHLTVRVFWKNKDLSSMTNCANRETLVKELDELFDGAKEFTRGILTNRENLRRILEETKDSPHA